MASKESLTLPDSQFDSSLDFDFESEFNMDFNQKAAPKSTARQVATGVYGGIKDTATDPNFYKNILRDVMPKHYGEISQGMATTTKGLYDLYDQTSREVKPRVNRITQKIDQLVPENQKLLHAILDKIIDVTGGRERESYSHNSEEQDNQSVQTMLSEIFNAEQVKDKIKESKDIIRDDVQFNRHKETMGVSLRMARDLSIMQQYTTTVNVGFQKKSLELQLRSYLAERSYFSKSLELFEIFRQQNNDIIQNTSLPDSQKITNFERIKNTGKQKLVDSLYGDGSLLQQGFGRLKDSASAYLEGIGNYLDRQEFGLDMAVMGKESFEQANEAAAEAGMDPVTRAEMAGNLTASYAMSFLSDMISPKLKKKLEGNQKAKDWVSKIARMAVNPSGALSTFRESQDWKDKQFGDQLSGRTFRFFDYLLEHFIEKESASSFGVGKDTERLKSPAIFDNRVHTAIVTVLPGYLSMIQREVASLRAGGTTPLLTFDYESSKFSTKEDMHTKAVAALIERFERSGVRGAIEEASGSLVKSTLHENEEDNTTEDQKKELKAFISKLSRENNINYDLSSIRETAAYHDLPEETKHLVDEYFSKMESHVDREELLTDFTKRMKDIRSRTPTFNEEFKRFIMEGHGDTLADTGLVKRNGDVYDTETDKIQDFIHSLATTFTSDVTAKEDIRATTPKNLLQRIRGNMQTGLTKAAGKMDPKKAYEGFKKTRLYDWFYKKGHGDQEPHSGPMAQDVQTNLGNEVAPDGHRIDIQTLGGSFFAAIQYLGDRVSKAFKGGDLEDEPIVTDKAKAKQSHLANIDKNIEKIEKILSTANFKEGSGISIGGGGGYREGFDANYFLDKAMSGISSTKNAISSGSAGTKDAMSKLWSDNKDRVSDAAISLFNKGARLAGTIFDSSQNFIANTIPNWLDRSKEFGKNVWKAIDESFQTVKDLYLPDGVEPIIRSVKLKAGFYIDKETGQPLTTVEQIMAASGDIVDSAGNIILTAQERAKGLYDTYGELVKGRVINAARIAMRAGRYLFGELSKGATHLKNFLTKGAAGFKEWWDSTEFKIPDFAISFYGKENYEELVNIRDILLGEDKEVRKRLRKRKAPSTVRSSSSEDGSSSGSVSSYSLKDELTAKYQSARSTVSDVYNKARDVFSGQEPDKEGTNTSEDGSPIEKNPSLAQRAKDKLKQWSSPSEDGTSAKDRILGQIKQKRDAMRDGAARLKKQLSTKKGFKNSLKKGMAATRLKVGGVASRAYGLLSGFMGSHGQQDPGAGVDGEDGMTDQEKEAQAHEEAERNSKLSERAKNVLGEKDRAADDADGDGLKDGGIAERDEKNRAMKASRDKEQLKADTSTRYKSKTNVLDDLSSKVSKFFDFLGGGMSTMFDVAATLFGGGKGLLNGAGGVAKGVGSLFSKGGLARGAFTIARLGLGMYGTAIGTSLSVASTVATSFAGLAASAAASVGGTLLSALATSTVAVPLVAAAAAYGLYKLYKYSTRDNVSAIERLRLRQYGFAYSTVSDKHNHNVLLLESYLQDGRVGYDQGNPFLLSKKIDHEELLATFDIAKTDKEKAENFSNWFENRFKPIFFTHLAALLKQDNKLKLNEVDKLTTSKKLAYLKDTKFNDGPYSYDVSPLGEDFQLDLNAEEIAQGYNNMISNLSAQEKQEDKKHALPNAVPFQDNKPIQAKSITQAQKDAQADQAKALQNNAKNNANYTQGGEGDGEKPRNDGASGNTAQQAVSGAGGIRMADGNLFQGTEGMAYIKLRNGSKLDGISPEMLKLFLGMAEEYGRMTGKTIGVNSGTRTPEEQAALYQRNPAKAARPGRSMHEFGLALDIDSATADELDSLGLMKKYGFTRPVGGERWHMEPAGIQRSLDLAKTNQSERELMVEASAGHGGGGYGASQGSTMGRRNQELAMKILGLPSKFTSKSNESADQSNKDLSNRVDETLKSWDSNEKPNTFVKSASNDATFKESKTNVLPMTKNANTLTSPLLRTEAESSGGKEAMGMGGGSGLKVNPGEGVESIIEKAAQRTGVDPNTLKLFAALESSMNPNAKSGGSSSGLMGFINTTWQAQLAQHASKYGINRNASPFDPEAAALMGGEYLKTNQRVLSTVTPNPGPVELYLGHLLGTSGAKKFLATDPNQIGAAVFPEAARNNTPIFYSDGRALTIREIYAKISEKLKKTANSFGIKLSLSSTGLKTPSPEKGEGVQPNLSSMSTPPTSSTTVNTSSSPSATKAPTFNYDSSSNSGGVDRAAQHAAPAGGGAINKLPDLLEKSLDIQEKSYDTLKTIAERLSKEALVDAFGTAIAAMPKPEPTKEEAVKVKDKENMGRTSRGNGPSIDLARRYVA